MISHSIQTSQIVIMHTFFVIKLIYGNKLEYVYV